MFRSRNEIFEILKPHVSRVEEQKLKQLVENLTPKELRHLDFLIFLTSYYKAAAPTLLKAILEILNEDEINFQALLQNFT